MTEDGERQRDDGRSEMNRGAARTMVLCACCLSAALLWPVDAEAQLLLSGRVAEEGSPITVATADVIVRDSLGRSVGYALTDEFGYFRMLHPGPGTYELNVDRVGYSPVYVDIALQGGVMAEFEISMSILPMKLRWLDVVVRRQLEARTLGLAGLAARKVRGLGDFIERADIENRPVSMTSDILAGQRGVRLVPVSGSEIDVRFMSTFRASGEDCPPAIWVDGMPLRPPWLDYLTLDDVAPSPSAIEAIEIYRRPAGVPVQYNTDAKCGVILIWTRR